jgi:hypothetical protein
MRTNKVNDKTDKIELLVLILQQIEHFESKKLTFIFDADYFQANVIQKKLNDMNNILKTEYLPIFN